MRIRSSRPGEAASLHALWRAAVDATHDFLDPADRDAIDAEVATWLAQASVTVAVDEDDRIVGFMAADGPHIDALFVDPAWHGRGTGRLLVDALGSTHRTLTVDVNAQNPGAIGFYERLGFARIGRSDTDGSGRPYPLLHLRRDG